MGTIPITLALSLMDLAPVPRNPEEPFVPDLSEGAEAGLYLSLFELMNEGLIITSDETILEVNSAVCRLMERSYHEMAGQPLSTLFPSERAFLSARGALFIQGEVRGSLRVKLPGGRERSLAYVAAARIRPGVHAIILSPDPVTGIGPEVARAADTVWPRLAAALDQPALVIDARNRIMAANAPARRRFNAIDANLTGKALTTVCSLSDKARDQGPVSVAPADGSPEMHGRLLTGPEPGWRILLLTGEAPVAPVDPRAGRVFRHAPLPMLVVRENDLRIMAANEAAAAAYGQSRQDLLQLSLDAVREPTEGKSALAPGLWHWRGENGSFPAETLVQALDGAHKEWLVMHDAPSAAWPTALSASHEQFSANAHAVLVTDANHRILSVNGAFEKLTGYTASQLRGEALETLATGKHNEQFFDTMRQSLAQADCWQGELWMRSPDGEALLEWLSFNTVRNRHGEVTSHIGLFSDLSTRQQAVARAEYLANHDALTGLPNHRFLETRFDEAVATAQRLRQHLAIVCLDIDGFRATNETFGHSAGDLVLQQLAGRLRNCSAHVQVARVASDQFCALISGIDLVSEVDREVERIRQVFNAPIGVQGNPHTISASLGIAIFPADGQDFSSLWTQAGNAMRNARLEGPGSCHFHAPALNAASLERMALESALSNAVERGAVHVHFQPVADATTGGIVAAEALVRWDHPDLGLLKPSQFMSAAQGSGLDCEIGFEALRVACEHAAEWHQAGMAIPFAINTTSNMLDHERLIDTLSNALSASRIPPAALALNIPEACLLSPSDALVKHLFAIDSLGVKLAVSGAGANPLPLHTLLELPFHALKLDRALVRDCLHPTRAKLLHATLAVANTLGLETQAVGVETPEQADAIAALGCERQQGHLYAPPRPADDFAQML